MPIPSVVGPTPPTIVPSPSVVGPTPYIHPSPSILTPSSIPSPDVHQPSTDPIDFGDPAPHDRPFIEPCGKGFLPSRVASQAITRSIKQQFLQLWASWGVIPNDDKKMFWQRFKVGEHIWNSLLAHWNSPQYRIKCAIAEKNRASEKGGVLHTGGSITTHEHAIRMQDFSARLTQARSEGGSPPDANSRVDADEEIIRTQCWVDVVGGKKKGRLYGVGELASHYSAGRGGIFRHQPSTFGTFDHNNIVSKDAYDSLLARFDNLENLVRTLIPQQGQFAPSSSQQPCLPQQPSQTTPVQDHDDSDDYDEY
ncbi:hypothetical protein LR48_Vigan311s000400 [Vigna angularis]|uniref:Uncharacterized protein n=1 Tax=Phaseolus angularis TaxID=3914 RepID=A0A0L9T802_PHAAN|nr:hypothetical protein LR48_Vigan311s000400 [Vigna angularis]